MDEPTTQSLGRRKFLRDGALAGLGMSLWPGCADAQTSRSSQPAVRQLVSLGKTGIRMSDISFGGSQLRSGEENLVLHALDRGINYFDTANSYSRGQSESVIGRALEGKRDKVHIASKVSAWSGARRDDLMSELEGSLRRLRTDYVDVYFNHAVNDLDRVKNPEWYEFTELARRQGKIRAVGMSGHAGHLIECLDYVIQGGKVDVILAAYNFGQDPRFYERFTSSFDYVARQPDLPRVLKAAKAKGIGVVAMKTLMGARLNDMRPFEKGGATFAQAAFRWVLSNPDVDGLIVSMTSTPAIDEYLGASGVRGASREDLRLLHRYALIQGESYCRHGCDTCADSCPSGVPIAEVLRARMYARDYGNLRMAQAEYALLGAGASACATCTHHSCATACDHGLRIDALLAPVDAQLRT